MRLQPSSSYAAPRASPARSSGCANPNTSPRTWGSQEFHVPIRACRLVSSRTPPVPQVPPPSVAPLSTASAQETAMNGSIRIDRVHCRPGEDQKLKAARSGPRARRHARPADQSCLRPSRPDARRRGAKTRNSTNRSFRRFETMRSAFERPGGRSTLSLAEHERAVLVVAREVVGGLRIPEIAPEGNVKNDRWLARDRLPGLLRANDSYSVLRNSFKSSGGSSPNPYGPRIGQRPRKKRIRFRS